MIVTAAMAYYDDDLALLDRTLRSLPIVADRLVVCDGRYERYMPDAPVGSPPEQLAFIRETCAEIGLPVTIDVPEKPWAGQNEKRTRLLTLARKKSDWIVNADADHVFHGVGHAIRWELEHSEADSIEVEYFTPLNHDRTLRESAANEWHAGMANDYAVINAFFRAYPGIQVEKRHWWYSAVRDGQRIWLWGGDARYPRGKVATFRAPFVIEHTCLFRQERHILANRAYCDDRSRLFHQTGHEDVLVAA